VIEGAIGAGKSVLSEVLKDRAEREGIKTLLIPEPVSEWVGTGILKEFYKDPKRWAYSMQTMAFSSRCNKINKMVEENPGAELVIIERSPASDQIFMYLLKKDFTETERAMYSSWITLFNKYLSISLNDATAVYLRTDLASCMTRLKTRGRAGEDGAEMEAYQQSLIDIHNAFLIGPVDEQKYEDLPRCPYKEILHVGEEFAALNFRDNEDAKEKITTYILDKCGLL